jgi:putative toxin-antitoxin system antitoxin component (TIGR02293 family)
MIGRADFPNGIKLSSIWRFFMAASQALRAQKRSGAIAPVKGAGGLFSSLARSDSARSYIDFKTLYRAGGMELVMFIKQGVHAGVVPLVAKQLHATQDQVTELLGFPRTTIARKIRDKGDLDLNQGELLVGLLKLIGQVETIVAESGNPEGFDAAQWTKEWLYHPNPALGGKRPADLMDTVGGQEVVSRLIAQMQSGAYA